MDETMSDQVDPRQESEEEGVEAKIVNEEYKIWKKNSVFLYDLLYGRALEWPTLTTQWLPDKRPVEGTNMSQHRMILGTHTSGQAQNHLMIAHVEIPDFKVPNPTDYNGQTGEIGGHGNAKKPFQFNIAQKINHPGEVNKACHQPQNPDIIASLCVDGRVLIFDRSKHPSNPKSDGTIQFEMELVGHQKEGFGLDWSPFKEGQIVTGNEDTTVRVWDTKGGFSKADRTIHPLATYTHHSAIVNDVQHHPIVEHWIGTVSDDLTWQVIDTRMATHKKALYRKEAHNDAVNCLAFHPAFESILATGSADSNIKLWDLRKFDDSIHTLEAHRDSVVSLQWHPEEYAILASSSYDRRILFWDTTKIGDEQTEDEAEDGPPELLFMHGGFTNRICDFDWNKNESWVMLAAAEDNQLQIFRPARALVQVDNSKKTVNHGESDESEIFKEPGIVNPVSAGNLELEGEQSILGEIEQHVIKESAESQTGESAINTISELQEALHSINESLEPRQEEPVVNEPVEPQQQESVSVPSQQPSARQVPNQTSSKPSNRMLPGTPWSEQYGNPDLWSGRSGRRPPSERKNKISKPSEKSKK